MNNIVRNAATLKPIKPYTPPYRGITDWYDMRIDPVDLKCVGYICEVRDGETMPVATTFLALLQEKRPGFNNQHFYYWVTAEHVINNIGDKPILRINRKSGVPFERETDKDEWRTHFDSDVAVFPFNVSDDVWKDLDIEWFDTLLFATEDYKRPNVGDLPITKNLPDIALGDDVIFFGLFAQHHGKDRNLPIVRFGNIVRMPTEERIRIEIDAAPTPRDIIAYLVEARSWGGQSGSPAIWQAEFTFKPKKPDVKPVEKKKKRISALLGVVSSHFDIKQKAEIKSDVFDDITTKLNTGIAIVVPAHVIKDLIMKDDELIAARDAKFAEIGKRHEAATPDLLPKSKDSDDLNPMHKEDFSQVLGEAAKGRKSND